MKIGKREIELLKSEVKFAESTIKDNKMSPQKALFFLIGFVSGLSLYGNLQGVWKTAFNKGKSASDVLQIMNNYINDNSK